MMKKSRLKAAVSVLFAVIATAGVTLAVPATAQAASDTIYLENWANNDCMTGVLPGYQGVEMDSCDSFWQGSQQWTVTTHPGYDTIENVGWNECLDGREGVGNLTLATCGVDGTHQHWIEITELSAGSYTIWGWENQYNNQCISGWAGYFDEVATLQECGSTNENQWWEGSENLP